MKSAMTKRKFLGKRVKQTPTPETNFIDNTTSLGLMIQHKRTSLNMSIKKTALLCGISDKSLRQLESGGNITTETLFKIINILGLKVRLDG